MVMGCFSSRDKVQARAKYASSVVEAASAQMPELSVMGGEKVGKYMALTMKENIHSSLKQVPSVGWGHLADYEVFNGTQLMYQIKYERSKGVDEVSGTRLVVTDARVGQPLGVLEKEDGMTQSRVAVYGLAPSFDGQKSTKVGTDGAPLYPFAEVVGAGFMGGVGTGSLDFKLFAGDGLPSEPWLECTMLNSITLSPSLSSYALDMIGLGSEASSGLEVLVETPGGSGGAAAAKIRQTDDAVMSKMRDLQNNTYAIEVAEGVDALAVVLMAVVYDKMVDMAIGQKRSSDANGQ